MKTIISFIISGIAIFAFTSSNNSLHREVEHTVYIDHPGKEEAVEVLLVEVQDERGLPVSYYTDVNSVICLEEVCKVISVRLNWNNIGQYQSYELDPGQTLEKYEADLFESEDYKKLQSILKDEQSPFKELGIEEILLISGGVDGVDAISGATIIDLDDEDNVHGAALTCYTLWHWANGDIIKKIRWQTGDSATIPILKDFLFEENRTYFVIALREFRERQVYTDEIKNAIVEKVLNFHWLARFTYDYLKEAPLDYYLSICERLFFEGGKEQKLAVIKSLKNNPREIPLEFLDKLSNEFNKLDSYQETAALLELLEAKNPNSEVVSQNVLPLLKDNFLVARRIYWFLNKRDLTEEQQKVMNTFFEENKQRL